MRKSTNIRYKTSWIDFCGDGRFPKERIKGKDKRFLGKWSRKKMAKEMKMDCEIDEENKNMARKYKVDEIHLEVTDLIPFTSERCDGFIIQWSSDIGFGEYIVYKKSDEDKWYGDSEHMDMDEDKDFIRELMKLFIDKLIIDD